MSEEIPIQSPTPAKEFVKDDSELDSETEAKEKKDTDYNEPFEANSVSEKTVSTDQDSPVSDPDNSVSETPKPLDNEARLEQLEKEHETLRSQYMRIAADFDNFRKRQSRDNDDLRLQLTCNTLSEILPVVDNFERARQQLDPQGEEAQALHRNYQGLYKQLVDVLKQLGVSPMRVVGQSFDPNLHEAVLREPSNEQLEDIITEELQRGYHLNGRVLRHALVKVSMGPGKSSDSETPKVDSSNSESSLTENDGQINSEVE